MCVRMCLPVRKAYLLIFKGYEYVSDIDCVSELVFLHASGAAVGVCVRVCVCVCARVRYQQPAH